MKGLIVMEADQACELLKNFPLGIRLLFVYNLKKWQKTQENDSISTSTPPFNLQTSANQPIEHHHQNNIDNMSIHLGDVLNSSNTGIMILQYYKSNQKLNDGIKVMLVDTIINWVITKKIYMSVGLAEQLANQVVAMFPTEVKVNIYYLVLPKICNYKLFWLFTGFVFHEA